MSLSRVSVPLMCPYISRTFSNHGTTSGLELSRLRGYTVFHENPAFQAIYLVPSTHEYIIPFVDHTFGKSSPHILTHLLMDISYLLLIILFANRALCWSVIVLLPRPFATPLGVSGFNEVEGRNLGKMWEQISQPDQSVDQSKTVSNGSYIFGAVFFTFEACDTVCGPPVGRWTASKT